MIAGGEVDGGHAVAMDDVWVGAKEREREREREREKNEKENKVHGTHRYTVRYMMQPLQQWE